MSKEDREEITDWLLKDENDQGVSTFIPRVVARVEKVDYISEGDCYVKLKLDFKKDESKEVLLPLNNLDQIDWFDLDQRCMLCPEYFKAGVYIANMIRRGIADAPTEKVCVLKRLGLHYIDGEHVFAAGDRVITRSSSQNKWEIKIEDSEYRLDFDSSISGQEAFEGILELINLSPETGSVIVAHVISGFIRSAFKEAGFIPCAVLVIIGESGMLKSHYVPQLTQLYNRSQGTKADTRLNSTSCFIEETLYRNGECTTVIDDLHTAESTGIKKRNESTAEEIIRRISDDTGRGHKEGKKLVQQEFRGNAVFIGEYDIGKESTVPRALVVRITKRPDGKILDLYQRQKKLHVSTFYCGFLQWYVEHYEQIRVEIDDRLTKFRAMTADSTIHGRLCDTKFYLLVSFMFFLEFCRESSFITQRDAVRQYYLFSSYLDNLIEAQQARFKASKDCQEKDYLQVIRKLYKKGRFHLSDDVQTFQQERHDGFIYQNCLCLRRKELEKRVQELLPNVQIDEVIQTLSDRQALKQGKDKRTIKISGLSREQGALRFYAIWLKMLE